MAVFELDGVELQQVGSIATGDRAAGGVFRHYIADQSVTVLRFGGDGGLAAMPEQVGTHLYSIADGALVDAGIIESGRYVVVGELPAVPEAPMPAQFGPITFLPGTSSAVVAIDLPTSAVEATLQASAGQVLTLDFSQTGLTPNAIAGVVALGLDGDILLEVAVGDVATMELPRCGVYSSSVNDFAAAECDGHPSCDGAVFFVVRVT